ncbi:peptide-methionine (S)-S-oxide reductase [Cyclobacterium sp. 1_MG-2023]|uniref:peptide-methionine (S)-S-oxide reductase n=1 Tax=Cyclobacterium sp. 1_MG-2023 TaxID=3062681 RepID=UPI0026E3029A|nr:peptide-methionine (S)-S-oxide reductase [Cyclobacterium sp. 1_MG-2023]MDO6438092.1 peptide-methionine (S)-S-oxide reductase [Cyclobacterium sp. 1_MG-2023]
MNTMTIGLGGGCHWCTEGVFRSVRGVLEVKQGWISSESPNQEGSEAVLVQFKPDEVNLSLLIAIHLHSHSCTADHVFRKKYRSAIYVFDATQKTETLSVLKAIKKEFDRPILTKVLPFVAFKENKKEFLDYYYKNPERPFCTKYIEPKLKALKDRFQKTMLVKTTEK